jgi:hypothetical protein
MPYEHSPQPSAMTGKAAQWIALLMLIEVVGLITLLCLR